jgi:hypothetical protein
MRPIVLPLSLALLTALVVGAIPTAAASGTGAAEGVTPVEATSRLATLSKVLRASAKATPGEVRSALDDVAAVYGTAGADAKEANKFRKQANALFLKALTRWKSPRGADAPNRHEAGCIRAAEILGDAAGSLDGKARAVLSRRDQGAIDNPLLKKHAAADISQEQLDASLAAVARLNSPKALDWYIKEFMHTKLAELRVLVAAHKSLRLFRDVPGVKRHAVVKAIIDRYAGVESRAHQGNSVSERAAKRLWDELRLHTVPALRHFAGSPTDAKGNALATVKAFQAWWRDHKKPKDAVWRDASKRAQQPKRP